MTRHGKSRRKGRLGARILKFLAFAVLIATLAGLSAGAGAYVALAQRLPSLENPGEFAVSQTTKIYDSAPAPTLLAELHGAENREVLLADEIPQVMRDAIVAVEDERFYTHQGVDILSIFRAVLANLRSGEIVQGGSTITQQFVKNAYISDEQTLDRKVREAALAYQLERRWSKEKILNAYLNTVYFGEGAYGVEAAAQTYFGVRATGLTAGQAALLAGLVKAPSVYSPRRDPETALARRDLVLNKMHQQGYISSAQLQEQMAAPLELASDQDTSGNAAPYWVEMIREQLVARYGSSTVLGGGLRVYTSIDVGLQKAAEVAIDTYLDREDDPTAALVCIDVASGRLVAMVGGRDFSRQQFNIALQGHRQPGSAFKPFVLVTALEQGFSPESTFSSGPVTIELPGGDWSVDSTDLGDITLSEATAKSSNGVFARLIMQVGAAAVADTARQMGIQTSLGEEPNPAIALGGLGKGVSPLEMAMAYATLATGGERLSTSLDFDSSRTGMPVTIVRVTDSDGRLIDEPRSVRTRVLDDGLSAVATQILRGVIERGTGTAADIGRPAAGKTGTTQSYRDAWFVGYTPELVTAVWVGYPDEEKAMTDVHGVKVTGGTFPAKIWAEFMRHALEGRPVTEFPRGPEGEWTTVEVCKESGLLATDWCLTKMKKLFAAGEAPTQECDIHSPKEVGVPSALGYSAAEAMSLMEAAGFVVSVVDDETAVGAPGTVVAQSPAAGELLLQGETVTLVIASGQADLVAVPSVVGLTVEQARAALEAAGLVPSESGGSSGGSARVVVDQTPVAGEVVGRGTTVIIVVSGTYPSTATTADIGVGAVAALRLVRYV